MQVYHFLFQKCGTEKVPVFDTKKAGTNIHRHIICLRDACAGCVRYVDSAPAQAGDKIFRVVPRYVGTLLTGFIVVVHNQLMQFV